MAQISTDGTVTVTLSVAPPADTSITGNELITIEFFVTPTASAGNGGPMLMKGGQAGFFCTITSGSTVLTTNGVNSVTAGAASAGGIGPMCPGGLAPISQAVCFASRTPLPLAPPCPTVNGVPLYMASVTYDVSDCATDSVDVHADPLGVADGVPAATDKSRFRDDGAGTGLLIPIVAETFATLVPDLGTCCDGTTCLTDGVNGYCCEQGLWGGAAGTFNPSGTTCAAPNPCACTDDTQCDDGLRCNGAETCNQANGQCVPGVAPNCNDNNFCTADSCSEAAPGNGCVNDAAAQNGAACGNGSDTDCDNPDTCLNGICATNNEPGGTPCGNPASGECDNADTCNGTGTCNSNNIAGACSSDGNACTNDVCAAGSCAHNPVSNGTACDDGLNCNNGETCNGGVCGGGTAVICDDGLVCTIDACVEPGGCVSTDINSIACLIDADCPPGSPCDGGFCSCVENPDLTLDPRKDDNGANCHDEGEMVFVDVTFGGTPATLCIAGGQFRITYDPNCLTFVDAFPGDAPWTLEIFQQAGAGVIFYAVGSPVAAGGGGLKCTNLAGVMATLKFTKNPGCDACDLCLTSVNPQHTRLTTNKGVEVTPAELGCSKDIYGAGDVSLNCPGDQDLNSDCGAVTATVNWPAVSASDSCHGDLNVNCTCTYTGEFAPYDCDHLSSTGGEFPQGNYAFSCSIAQDADNVCNEPGSCTWTVNVSDEHTFDVKVELSPIVEDTEFTRCICFELFSSCSPLVYVEHCETLTFGGPFNFQGQAHDDIKVPKGKHRCITARDRQHSLRASYSRPDGGLLCVGNEVKAEFKGDPFFGGNWLIQGNLNRDRVIDILDFGTFLGQLNQNPTPAPKECDDNNGLGFTHADFNGDGIVNAEDFSFIQINFLEDDKNICCPGHTGSDAVQGLTEVSVKDLREMGLEDLAIADLNNDGLLNVDDMASFLQGARPKAAGKVNRGGSNRPTTSRK
ncbi:MAG: hypothetical protein AABZ47_03170 [Planctomycetota bacterium]